MTNSIYNDIAERTQGDIYIGVVGPVRTGKSTFIKRFMDTLVIPSIDEEFKRERAKDELPQSAAGRTIMTTEPKFIPEDAIELNMADNVHMNVRLIDCVGYIVPSAVGYIEEDQPRMVRTPWYEEEIPFNMAAEIGTKKVITEHSTIGLVVTTDGSIGSISRDEYEEAEERVISELREINKPFIVLLNSAQPGSQAAVGLAASLCEKYGVPVLPVNCLELDQNDISEILNAILLEFPIHTISLDYPKWLLSVGKDNWLRCALFSNVRNNISCLNTIRSVEGFIKSLSDGEYVDNVRISDMDLGTGNVSIKVSIEQSCFYKILSDSTGVEIADEKQLMKEIVELSGMRKEYKRFLKALDDVERDGYGIVMPTMEEMSLEEPEIMKQGGRYGIRLKAQAPSIHMIKCNTYTEVAPIVGSESQSQELVMYLLKEFEENPNEIWDTNIFGTSLLDLVNEGLKGKLYRMPEDARIKFKETIERVINEGCSGLICIIL